MDDRFHTLRAQGITLVLDRMVGHIRSLEIAGDGRTLRPLHTAPWVDDPAVAADQGIAPNVAALSGDFLCAPFGGADEAGTPPHGWPANAPWRHLETVAHPAGGATARFRLERTVEGATVEKELTLRDGHPFVYARHVFLGGTSALPVATHAMTRLSTGGRLAVSPKTWAETPAAPLEPDPARGRFALRYPARVADLAAFPRAAHPLTNGGIADLRAFPFAEAHEEFVALLEAPGSRLGWTAASRDAEDDIVLSLKDPGTFPLTMLWVSNGGRDYAPWNGRHTGVLGIEEGRTFSLHGRLASIRPNPLSAAGVPTALALRPEGTAEVRHVVGALPRPAGWETVEAIEAEGNRLMLRGAGGASVAVPFDGSFLSAGR